MQVKAGKDTGPSKLSRPPKTPGRIQAVHAEPKTPKYVFLHLSQPEHIDNCTLFYGGITVTLDECCPMAVQWHCLPLTMSLSTSLSSEQILASTICITIRRVGNGGRAIAHLSDSNDACGACSRSRMQGPSTTKKSALGTGKGNALSKLQGESHADAHLTSPVSMK